MRFDPQQRGDGVTRPPGHRGSPRAPNSADSAIDGARRVRRNLTRDRILPCASPEFPRILRFPRCGVRLATAAAWVGRPPAITPKTPARGVLYQMVRDHFETFRAEAARLYGLGSTSARATLSAMSRVNLTLDQDTQSMLERYAKRSGRRVAHAARELVRESLLRRDAVEQAGKLAADYAEGRADARALLKDMEGLQLEWLIAHGK